MTKSGAKVGGPGSMIPCSRKKIVVGEVHCRETARECEPIWVMVGIDSMLCVCARLRLEGRGGWLRLDVVMISCENLNMRGQRL